MSSRRAAVTIFAIACACGDGGAATTGDSGESGESTTTGSTTSSTASTSGTTDATESSSGRVDDGSSSGESGFDPPRPECGNGYVESGEECDDANAVDDDACTNTCLLPCGIDWAATHLGPTQESDIFGVQIAVDGAGNSYAVGMQREVTVDMKGIPTLGDITTLVVAFDPEGTELWSVVRANAGLTLDPGDIAVDSAGDPVIATTNEVATGGRDVQVVKLAAADGTEVWATDLIAPVADGDDLANGIAATADGDVILAATVRVADMDDDVWVRRLAGADGGEVWTATWDGGSMGTFSTDNGGPLAVGPGGEAYVLVQPYVDFMTVPVTLLALPAGGGTPTWSWTPQQPGAEQEFVPVAVTLGDDGSVYAAYQRLTAEVEFWVAKLDPDGNELWSVDRDHFIGRIGDNWRLTGLAYAPGQGPIASGLLIDTNGSDDWADAWVTQLDPEAVPLCAVTHESPGRGFVPPLLFTNGSAVAPDGGPMLVGELVDTESALWVGRFRPYGG